MKIWLLFFLTSFMFKGYEPPASGSLVVEINNIEAKGGMVWVGVYDSQRSFMVQELATVVQGERVEGRQKMYLYLDKVPFGTYAIALFHDENNNGYMDQNFIGLPVEPYAFSMPPVSKWRKPKFEEMKFDFKRPGQVVKTTLERW